MTLYINSHLLNNRRLLMMDCYKIITAVFLVFGFPAGTYGQNAAVLTGIVVSETKLAQATNFQQIPASNALACAMKASAIDWSDLVCYVDETCHLYELPLPANFIDDSPDANNQCFTKYGKGCVTDTGFAQDGEIVVDGCITKVCRDSVFTNSYGSSQTQTCSDPQFDYVPGVGCLLLLPELGTQTQSFAVTKCAEMAAQLVVPESYEALQEYINCKSDSWYWLGIQNLQWNDGTDVNSLHFGPSDPEYTDGCGLFYWEWTIDTYAIKTNPCDWGHHIMCQLI